VGSTLIDYKIAQHIAGRLELIKDHLEGEVYHLAEEMLTGQFQTVKHSFPHPIVEEVFVGRERPCRVAYLSRSRDHKLEDGH
jgi:hypothetical protein